MNSGVLYKTKESPKPNFTRFETTLKYAAEFVLRKDYRDHWSPELLEEYCYYSQKDFEENFRKENLRIVVSMPLWNPWIVENRFVGKFYLSDLDEKPSNISADEFFDRWRKSFRKRRRTIVRKWFEFRRFFALTRSFKRDACTPVIFNTQGVSPQRNESDLRTCRASESDD